MRHFAVIAAFVALCLSCDRGLGEPSSGHQEEHEHYEPHEHEPRHDEVPRSVELSGEVIEQAAIVTAPAERRVIAPSVRLPGEVAAHPDKQASVAARVDGIIESIRVLPGDTVERGQILARVRAPNLQSLRAAEAALRAKAVAARTNADRVSGLVETRMASRQEAVAAVAEADALEAEAQAARERLRALGVRRSSRRAVTFDVRAPIAGIVLERGAVAGAPVTAETVVATIVATDEVWFLAHVFERDVARVEQGAQAAVSLNAYPDDAFVGRVDYISAKVDPGARTLSARIPLLNPDGRLRLGLFGTAHVVATAEPSTPVVAVPNSAITQMQGRPVVFVRHPDGHFEVHEVVLGRSDPQYTEIVRGVHESERVVTEGAFTVKSALLRGTFGEDHH